MRRFIPLTLALLFLLLNLLTSYLLSKEAKKGISERYLLLNRVFFVAVPRDVQFAFTDLNFINTLSFIGYSLEKGGGHLTRKDGLKIFASLDAVTTFNPKYFDPYYVSNAFLTWEVGLYREAVYLLKRGLRFVDDWRIPFYIGFIYFYFLGDNLKGAKYLEMAARHPLAREYNLIPLLASRLYYEEGKLELAVVLLREQLKIMKDEKMKEAIRSRIETLEKALLIQRAVRKFRKLKGRNPKDIRELSDLGLIPPDLRDSAGGRFYITPDGKVRSERVLFPLKRGR